MFEVTVGAPRREGRSRSSAAKRKSGIVAAALVAALSVAACGDDDTDAASGSGGTATATDTADAGASPGVQAAVESVAKHRKAIESFTPPGPGVDGSSLRGKTIYFVPVGSALPVVTIQGNAMKAAARSLGMKVRVCDGKFIPSSMAACVRQAVDAGAAGIATVAVDPASISTALEYASRKDVPVYSGGEAGTSPDEKKLLIGPSGDIQTAPVSADWIVAESKGDASVVAGGVSGDAGTIASMKAFEEGLAERCPKCEVESVSSAPSAPDEITSLVSTALLRNPDTSYAWAQFDSVVPPLEKGVQQSGKDITVVSTTAAIGQMREVKSGGPQVADIAINHNYYGYYLLDGVIRMMLDEPAATNTELPIRIFDKTNIDSIELTDEASQTGEWWGSTAYQQEFPKLWGAK